MTYYWFKTKIEKQCGQKNEIKHAVTMSLDSFLCFNFTEPFVLHLKACILRYFSTPGRLSEGLRKGLVHVLFGEPLSSPIFFKSIGGLDSCSTRVCAKV